MSSSAIRSSRSSSPSACDDLGPAVVVLAVDLLELEQLLADQRHHARLVAEDRAELGDPLAQVGVLCLDPLPLERGQRAQAEVEDRLGLDLREVELLHQALARRVGVLGRADERDHLVEVVERDQVALEDVRALLGLAQLELRAADDDRALELEVVAQELEQRQRLRHAVDERDRVVAERRLQRGVLEELVEDDLRDRLALQLDDDAHARLVGRGRAAARSRRARRS